VAPLLADAEFRTQLCALRLAVLFHHARRPIALPRLALEAGRTMGVDVPARWLAAHPLTDHLLQKEADEWRRQGFRWRRAR
jgi:exopolyphosphatase/guanosine-5'-triphosphate,3'-diphosphate pyrophosphatase